MAAPPTPGNAVVSYASGTDIEVRFTFTPIVPATPQQYFVVWNLSDNPNDPAATAIRCGIDQFNTANVEFTIPGATPVYIWGRAVGNGQTTNSAQSTVFTADAADVPGTPYLVGVTGTQITVNFQAAVQPGSTSYAIVYGTVNNPTDPGSATNTVFIVQAPDIFGSGPFAVPQGVNVYIWARSTNEGIVRYSGIPLVYNSTAGGVAPSGPTSTPVLVSATNTSLIVAFDRLLVTGTPPFTVTCGASTSATGPFDIACIVTGAGPNYQAVNDSPLDFATTYYFQTIISNGTLPNQTSAVSAGFTTLDAAKVADPAATLVQATQITMRFTMSVTYFNPPAPNLAELRWGTENLGPALLPNSVPVTYLGLFRGDPVWEATLYNLTPGKSYYFQGYYGPLGSGGVSNTVAVSTFRGNAFDLGYMPPRGWAVPNPVIVAGVSQPWRQT